jgi:hypothetical protein
MFLRFLSVPGIYLAARMVASWESSVTGQDFLGQDTIPELAAASTALYGHAG